MSNPAKQGYQAFERGASIMSNPYTWPTVSKQAEQWESGFIKARSERQRQTANWRYNDLISQVSKQGY